MDIVEVKIRQEKVKNRKIPIKDVMIKKDFLLELEQIEGYLGSGVNNDTLVVTLLLEDINIEIKNERIKQCIKEGKIILK